MSDVDAGQVGEPRSPPTLPHGMPPGRRYLPGVAIWAEIASSSTRHPPWASGSQRGYATESCASSLLLPRKSRGRAISRGEDRSGGAQGAGEAGGAERPAADTLVAIAPSPRALHKQLGYPVPARPWSVTVCGQLPRRLAQAVASQTPSQRVSSKLSVEALREQILAAQRERTRLQRQARPHPRAGLRSRRR